MAYDHTDKTDAETYLCWSLFMYSWLWWQV